MDGRSEAKKAPSQDSDYDESADSDFNVSGSESGDSGTSSEEAELDAQAGQKKRQKVGAKGRQRQKQSDGAAIIGELDSGDEVTLKEGRKAARRQQRQRAKEGHQGQDDGAAEGAVDGQERGAAGAGWRAKTRSMREREEEARQKGRLASIKGSTVDVDALWARLNAPDAFRRLLQERRDGNAVDAAAAADDEGGPSASSQDADANKAAADREGGEMITITRTYQFAGEQHTETKLVARSSAEGRLWLQQQEAARTTGPQKHAVDGEGRTIVRPLRKVSRFDPNLTNMEAFKGQWTTTAAAAAAKKGPRLNVVEKSKLDWASHVDAEGLKEELDVAAKAKDSYLHRTDFLRDVEMRKEDEAREARMKARQ